MCLRLFNIRFIIIFNLKLMFFLQFHFTLHNLYTLHIYQINSNYRDTDYLLNLRFTLVKFNNHIMIFTKPDFSGIYSSKLLGKRARY
jgi:hypothetical protein